MGSKEEKFEITWEELKFLIGRAQGSINSELPYATSSEDKERLLAPIKAIKQKYDYDARVQRDRREHNKQQREDQERKRQEELKRSKITKKQQENNLQELLDQSKLEILHWFTKYSESERELNKLRIRSKRDYRSLEWYKTELEKERKAKKTLEERIELLESLLNAESVNHGA